jgi:hypothetical protein
VTTAESVTWDRVAAQLLDPASPLLRAWGRHPVHLPGLGVEHLFDSLDATLATELLGPPFVSMFSGQRPIAVERYTSETGGAVSLPPTTLLDRAKMLDELARGAGIKLNRMQLWNPRVRAVAADLAAHFGLDVEVWGFFSGTGQAMLPWHRDHADNLAVQISGTKRWYVGGGIASSAAAENYHRLTDEVEEYCLAPGDVLHVPYGWAHKAEAVSRTSYHLSIAVGTPSVGAVRQVVLAELASRWPVDGMLPVRSFDRPALEALFPASLSTEVRQVLDELGETGLKNAVREVG